MRMRYELVISRDDDVAEREIERVMADLPAMLEELEENLTDLLPEGYSASFEQESRTEE